MTDLFLIAVGVNGFAQTYTNDNIVFRYLYPVSSDGETQTLNPEVRGAGPRAAIVRDQIFALTTITSRLRSAFNGQDVDWIDAGLFYNFLYFPLE